MRIEAIRSFVRLVEAGSYSAAAESLYMSPTTMHGHVRSLESELGATLATFAHRRLQLTRAGNLFMVAAERILTEHQRVHDEISGAGQPAAVATLRIATTPSIGVYILPRVVQAFATGHPEALVTVYTGRAGEALATLASGQAEMGVLSKSNAAPSQDLLDSTDVMTYRMVAVAHRDTTTRTDDPLGSLSQMPISAQPRGYDSRQYLERWAQARDIRLKIRFEHSAFDGILSDVRFGCIGVIPHYVCRLSDQSDDLVELDLPSFTYDRTIVALQPSRPRPIVREFVGFLREFLAAQPSFGQTRP